MVAEPLLADGRLTDNNKPTGKSGPTDAAAFWAEEEEDVFAGACVLPADLTLRTDATELTGLGARYTTWVRRELFTGATLATLCILHL